MKNLIAIDFDGVIRIDDKPAEYVYEALDELMVKYDLVIFTARNTKEVREWLVKHNFPKLYVTNIKPDGACAYIDDRAVKFTHWKEITEQF